MRMGQAIHVWPDNWKVSGADFMTQWVNCHITAAASLGKPLLLEEVRPLPAAPTGPSSLMHAKTARIKVPMAMAKDLRSVEHVGKGSAHAILIELWTWDGC